ncbi:hypothetical protein DBR17_15005, partial [Sphingomonas sp. HMWF008]
ILGSPFLGSVARGALSSAVTQGIGVATRLQSKFDFVGVAAAGVGAGVGDALGAHFTAGKGNSFTFGERVITNAASGLANAATRSVVSGTDFGDNLMAALPDIIGNTIGGFIADRVAGSSDDPPAAKGKQYAQTETRDAMGRPVVTRTDYVAESEPDIIVTARKLGEEAIKRGRGFFGWLGDGIDSLTGFTNLGGHHPHKRSTASNVVSFNFSMSIARAQSSLANGGSMIVNNFQNDYLNRVNRGIASMRGGWATLNDSKVYSSGDGIAANLNTLKGLGSVLGGGIEYLTSPIIGSVDTILGRPISSFSGGVISPSDVGNDALVIGSLFAGPEAALGSRTGGAVAAEEAAPFSQIVTDGGLIAHEAPPIGLNPNGGHLLLKHVGKTEQQLLDRFITEPNISGSSSFFDRATAEAAASGTLDANQVKIADWMAGTKPQLPVTHLFADPVGISIRNGATTANDAFGVRLLLRRDAGMRSGYRIHTGYPE